MLQFRWKFWDLADGPPPMGAVPIGNGAQQLYQVLQIRVGEQRYTTEGVKLPLLWRDWETITPNPAPEVK